jgi:hypothetical protein
MELAQGIDPVAELIPLVDAEVNLLETDDVGLEVGQLPGHEDGAFPPPVNAFVEVQYCDSHLSHRASSLPASTSRIRAIFGASYHPIGESCMEAMLSIRLPRHNDFRWVG